MRIACDLDGVLADFNGGVFKIFGKMPNEIPPKIMWPVIAKEYNFFSNLDWMSDGQELWNNIQQFNPYIITGLPRGTWGEIQKRTWCKEQLGNDVQVICCVAREKTMYMKDINDILIDDRVDNCQRWIDVGGRAIHHISTENTLSILNEILNGVTT
jgi:hypothetical protein